MDLRISYDGTEVTLDRFVSDQIIRQRISRATVQRSATGNVILGGAPYVSYYQFSVSAIIEAQDRDLLEALYESWDADRAAGEQAQISVADSTFGPELNSFCWFTSPPAYSKGSALSEEEGASFEVSFVLTETG